MTQILSNYTASISELKISPNQILQKCNNEAVAILNHNKPSAYLVPAALYEKMMEKLDDYQLVQEVKARLEEDEKPIRVSLDEL